MKNVFLLVAGYLGVWGLFGLAAHLIDLGLHRVVAASPWLTFNGWVFGAGVLASAGLFQFSPLKHRCLDRCRPPGPRRALGRSYRRIGKRPRPLSGRLFGRGSLHRLGH